MAFFDDLSHIGFSTKDFYKSTELYEKLGFELIDQEDNLGSKVNFYQINDLILEVYEDKTNSENGAINHLAIATDEIDKTWL